MSYAKVLEWQRVLSKHNLKVYPINFKRYALIEVEYKGVKKRFDKKIQYKVLNKWDKNNPIYKTMEFYYNKLK